MTSQTPGYFLFGDDDTSSLELDSTLYEIQNSGASYAISQFGTDGLQFQVEAGDVWAPIDPATKNRSEIASTDDIPDDTPINVSYIMNIQPGAANTAAWCVLGQFHQNDGPNTPAASPPFEINMNGEQMQVVIGYSGPGGSPTYLTVFSDPVDIVRGENYAMNISVRFDSHGNGNLVVTRNGITIVNYSGPLGYATQSSVYWKEGIYRAASSTTMAVDYSNLAVTTGTPTTPTGNENTQTYNTYSDTGAVLSTTTNVVDAGGKTLTATVVYAGGSKQVSTYQIAGETYTTMVQKYSGTGALINLAEYNSGGLMVYQMSLNNGIRSVQIYTAAGVLSVSTTTNTDGSEATTYFASDGVTVTEYKTYNAAGLLTENEFFQTTGARSVYLYDITGQNYTSAVELFNATGQLYSYSQYSSNGDLHYQSTTATDGVITDSLYDTNGNLINRNVINTDGSHVLTSFSPGSANPTDIEDFNSSGVLTLNEIFNSDGTYQIVSYQIAGEPYTRESIHYNSAGQIVSDTQYQANGNIYYNYSLSSTGARTSNYYDTSGRVSELKVVAANGATADTAYQTGVTLISDGNNDTMYGFNTDTFEFNSHFGADTIINFVAAGATHDIIQISTSLASSFAQLLLTQTAGNATIQVTPSDTITLTGTKAASLSASDFSFH